MPCAPVNDVPAALADPQAVARGAVCEMTDDQGEVARLIAPAPRLSATPATIRSAPPRLGQHTDAILRDLLGYDEQRVAALHEEGAV